MKRRLLFLFVLLTLLGGLMVTFTNVAHAQTGAAHISSSLSIPAEQLRFREHLEGPTTPFKSLPTGMERWSSTVMAMYLPLRHSSARHQMPVMH